MADWGLFKSTPNAEGSNENVVWNPLSIKSFPLPRTAITIKNGIYRANCRKEKWVSTVKMWENAAQNTVVHWHMIYYETGQNTTYQRCIFNIWNDTERKIRQYRTKRYSQREKAKEGMKKSKITKRSSPQHNRMLRDCILQGCKKGESTWRAGNVSHSTQ